MRNALGSVVAILLLVLPSGGCVVAVKRPYEPQGLEVPANSVVLMAAVLQQIADAGWRVVRIDAANGQVVALSPETAGSGITTRERWAFLVEESHVSVAMRLEMKTDFVWRTHTLVCDSYQYLRERTALHAVALRARPPGSPGSAPRPAAALLLAMEDGTAEHLGATAAR